MHFEDMHFEEMNFEDMPFEDMNFEDVIFEDLIFEDMPFEDMNFENMIHTQIDTRVSNFALLNLGFSSPRLTLAAVVFEILCGNSN